MKSKYRVGNKVTAFRAEWTDDPLPAFYTGIITKVEKSKYADVKIYEMDYVNYHGETKSITLYEDEIDFVQMTIR